MVTYSYKSQQLLHTILDVATLRLNLYILQLTTIGIYMHINAFRHQQELLLLIYEFLFRNAYTYTETDSEA